MSGEVICVVDDDTELNNGLCTGLRQIGYIVHSFVRPVAFLDWFRDSSNRCSLIITDINMPEKSGYELCREVRRIPRPERVPIIMMTGSSPDEKATALDAGADDLLHKPFQMRNLMAKVQSLLKIRAEEMEKFEVFSRFVSPSVASLLVGERRKIILQPHRVDISVAFIDLRGFTAFAESSEPEALMTMLNSYYSIAGNLTLKHSGTLGNLAGDGIMVFFNDPTSIEHHRTVAVQFALEARTCLSEFVELWKEKGYSINFGIGVAEGYATVGGVGFDQYWQYSAIGPVVNFASRICQAADNGQILVSDRFLGRMACADCKTEFRGKISLKGFPKIVSAHNVLGIN